FLLACPGVAVGLVLGQPMPLLAWAIGEAYVALRAGEDLRAGLWLGVLFLKPQYIALLLLVLLWKRRWAALAGSFVGLGVVVIGSFLIVGPSQLLAYPSVIGNLANFSHSLTNPADMINWRAILLAAAPGLGDHLAIAIVAALGLMTIGLTLYSLRGPWQP